jgi:hypothetical protein
MDESRYKFQGTNLSPGLQHALSLLGGAEPDRARRVYVLTDGELGDAAACASLLRSFPEARIEVHAYGFGAHFNASSLKELLREQLGGSVKPICNEQDIFGIFAHLAELNQRVVARDARLSVRFSEEVDCGDAFSFRPQERYLGRVEGRSLSRELGRLESGRSYALLFEVRLPPGEGRGTTIGEVTLSFTRGAAPESLRADIVAPRHEGGPEELSSEDPEVRDAAAIVAVLARAGDKDAEQRAVRAKLELAQREKRDPGLLEALQKQLDILEGRSASLNSADVQYLDADMSSAASFSR